MMAARFRSVTWVAVAVVPALACYLVTQYVAAERAQLARVERRIGQTRLAIRELETELGTRGSMAQIERWNGQTFALAAPAAEQFITGDVQLASLAALPALPAPAGAGAAPSAPVSASAAPAEVRQATVRPPEAIAPSAPAVRQAAIRPAGTPAAPAIRQASFEQSAKKAPAISHPVREAAAHSVRAEIRQAAFKPAPRRAAPDPEEAQPLLRQATYVKPPRDQAKATPTKVAMLANGPLGSRSLAEIGRIADAERGSRRQ